MRIDTLSLLEDNFSYLLVDDATKFAAIVDPSEAAPVVRALETASVTLSAILVTHHHWDHVGGVLELRKRYQCPVYAPYVDAAKVAGCDHPVTSEEPFALGPWTVQALAVPGHTLGATAYWFPREAALFTGDTLFLMGCGRMFEGDPEAFHSSLNKLSLLPPETRVFCGHEYTISNWRFASSIAPNDAVLAARGEQIRQRLAQGLPSVPGTIAEERATNPFLQMRTAEDFAALRAKKDHFR